MSEKIYFNAEGFNLKTEKLNDGSDSIVLEGIAMPLGKMSRNKVFYRPESVKKAYKTMEGAAFLFNHNTDISLGHVESVSLDDSNMSYRANMDPEEKKYVNKVKRQDIRHVSVGCLVSNFEYNEEQGTVTCDIDEFVELSLVPVPGFGDTTAQVAGEYLEATPLMIAEKFGDKKAIEKLKSRLEKKESDEEDPEKSDEEEEPEDDKEKCKKKNSSKNKEADEEPDKSDEEEEPKDSEEAEDEDEEEKDKEESVKKKEADDEDQPEDDMDDSEEEEEEDPEKKKESEDEGDKEESVEAKSDEELGNEEEDETPEEKISKLMSRVEELFSSIDEMVNRLTILESKVDAMNDEEDETSSINSNNLLSAKVEEKFVDTKYKEKLALDMKKNNSEKEKLLLGSESKKINGEKKVVDMSKVRRNNISY